MPLLDKDELKRLRSTPGLSCRGCKRELSKNYCRECDEFFYTGHGAGCTSAPKPGERDYHEGHRTY